MFRYQSKIEAVHGIAAMVVMRGHSLSTFGPSLHDSGVHDLRTVCLEHLPACFDLPISHQENLRNAIVGKEGHHNVVLFAAVTVWDLGRWRPQESATRAVAAIS